jgi:hypothetical protein
MKSNTNGDRGDADGDRGDADGFILLCIRIAFALHSDPALHFSCFLLAFALILLCTRSDFALR